MTTPTIRIRNSMSRDYLGAFDMVPYIPPPTAEEHGAELYAQFIRREYTPPMKLLVARVEGECRSTWEPWTKVPTPKFATIHYAVVPTEDGGYRLKMSFVNSVFTENEAYAVPYLDLAYQESCLQGHVEFLREYDRGIRHTSSTKFDGKRRKPRPGPRLPSY